MKEIKVSPASFKSLTSFGLLIWFHADEIDAIGTKRYESQSGGEREIQRTMLELLNQMDGFDSMGGRQGERLPVLLCHFLVHISG